MAMPVIVLNTSGAVRNTPSSLTEMGRSFQASHREVITKIIIPAASPVIFSGLRLGVSAGFIGAILSELKITPTGVGDIITYSRSIADYASMYAGDFLHHLTGCSVPEPAGKNRTISVRREMCADMPQTNAAISEPMVNQTDIAVSARNVSKNYGDVEALKDLSLEFPRGQLTSLLGPSGCGKNDVVKKSLPDYWNPLPVKLKSTDKR